jgi:4-amino-4-deoxy-L-arabinose transferase-like glycosyltransferase
MQASARPVRHCSRAQAFTWITTAVLAFLRLAHIHLLWADEDFHLAAALNLLHGRIPYRDFLYDKPPLSAFYYLLIGAYPGWPLRLLDGCYVLLACYLAYRIAREWWGELEGQLAAVLLAFFMAFYLPSAVISFAPDALMIVPHLAAIYFVQRRSPFWSGLFAGIAFLVNTKAVFVLAICGLWVVPAIWSELVRTWVRLAIGFAVPLLASVAALLMTGAWHDYVEQVWLWGFQYAKQPPTANPLHTGLTLTSNWVGFHSALVVAAIFALWKMRPADRLKMLLWLVLSFIAVSLGGRFSPRYFLQLLPPLVVAASRGFVLLWQAYRSRAAAVLAVLLLIPLARFGPRYIMLAANNVRGREPQWADVAMDLDNQHAAAKIRALAQPGDTLFVWGLRSSIYVYTRMISDSRFWDSEPLTGVPGDRHLSAATVIDSGPAAAYRRQLVHSRPTFIVDGLGPLNPRLAPEVYPELWPWLSTYRVVGRTGLTVIYRNSE